MDVTLDPGRIGVWTGLLDSLPAARAVETVAETLARTTLGQLQVGREVNLERALRADGRLGGHMVLGHVDGVGRIRQLADKDHEWRVEIEPPPELARFVAAKGSIAIDGVSLTVNAVDGSGFEVMIVPHTLENTIISDYRSGTRVNIEVDMIARYLERILQYTDASNNREGAK